jgi:predicted CXXCH cytochrome family protein
MTATPRSTMTWLTISALACLAVLPAVASAPPGYVDPALCAGCHTQIAKDYSQTAMARSFFRPRPENTIEDYEKNNTYYHAASERYYQTYRKAGKYYQLRYQIGFDGKKTNVVEKEIQYVIGSGNHARTYLHRRSDGVLAQLPVSWYAEDDGYWGMSPGYDRPDHWDFRRRITVECMFCHNGYPGGEVTSSEPVFQELPEGIDCQRCHGPGQSHAQAVRSGNSGLARASIVNPSRLSPEGQMEVCMQCHLESTTFPLPPSLRRYGRGVFSYRPGEPLANYILHFQRSSESARETFEINHAAYRLRMSACFRVSNSSGKQMTCITCHDPHHVLRGDEAFRRYTNVCLSCHEKGLRAMAAVNRHPSSTSCVACHMPKRRTDDVVHGVMTDHYIQRRKPDRDLLGRREEPRDEQMAQHGPALLYYPPSARKD